MIDANHTNQQQLNEVAEAPSFVVPFQEGYNPEHPYDVCIACIYYNTKRCDGPNILAMTPERRCEFLHARLDFLHAQDKKWGYKYIADQTGLAEATVRRIITEPDYDPRITSLQDVCRTLGGSWGEYPCALMTMRSQDVVQVDRPETLELLKSKDQEIDQLKQTQQRLIDRTQSLQRDVDFLIKEAEVKTKVIEKLLTV